jgi:hypothetical protein
MFLPFPLSWVRPKANGWQAGPRFSPRDQMPSPGARKLSVNAMATLQRYSCTRDHRFVKNRMTAITINEHLGLSVPLGGTQEPFTRFGTGTRLESSSTWGRAAQTKRL